MKMKLTILFCLCTFAAVCAQSQYGGFNSDGRLAHICRKHGESPYRDFTGRIRRCVWSRPPCPFGSNCRDNGRDYVCCRRIHGPGQRRCRDGGRPHGFCLNDRQCSSSDFRCEFDFGFIGRCCRRYPHAFS